MQIVQVIPTYLADAPGGDSAPLTRDHGLLFVGRLAPEKNLGVLIEAMADLPSFHLHIVGSGPLYPRIRDACRSLSSLQYHGNLPNSDVRAMMRRAFALVVPSRYEQAPKVVWEAMGERCLVIGTPAAGLVDGQTGLCFDGSTQGLLAAVDRAMRLPDTTIIEHAFQGEQARRRESRRAEDAMMERLCRG